MELPILTYGPFVPPDLSRLYFLGRFGLMEYRLQQAFAREFAARGPRDSKGRSLRDFDLGKRIFRYPCSYLIYNEAFDSLPEASKTYVYHRLLQILSGEDDDPDFESLSAQDRQAILEILLETKPGLPQEWHDYAKSIQKGTRK